MTVMTTYNEVGLIHSSIIILQHYARAHKWMCLFLAQFLYSLSRKIKLFALSTAFFQCFKTSPHSA